MTRTILEIAQEAAVDAGYQEPTTVFGDDRLSRTLRTAAHRTIEHLMRSPGERGWSALNSLWILETVPGQAVYDLPEDYHTMIPNAQIREGFPVYLCGPTRSESWVAMQAGGLVPAIGYRWRVRHNSMEFQPTPGGSEKVFIEYRSKYPVESNVFSGWDNALWDTAPWDDPKTPGRSDRFGSDEDQCRLPSHLLSLGITYRLLKARGQPYADEQLEYQDAVNHAAAHDHGGLSEIALGERDHWYGQMPTNDGRIIIS